jgi:hypothetical protein
VIQSAPIPTMPAVQPLPYAALADRAQSGAHCRDSICRERRYRRSRSRRSEERSTDLVVEIGPSDYREMEIIKEVPQRRRMRYEKRCIHRYDCEEYVSREY